MEAWYSVKEETSRSDETKIISKLEIVDLRLVYKDERKGVNAHQGGNLQEPFEKRQTHK